ncbi:MAG: DUF169 domain-containing protein [Deltaproteobacteria bacterium]|nr:DUF169 domain-containing protein [Deltaproteobacteria bacterium]
MITNKKKIQDTLEKAYCALKLKRKIVGVRFLFDQDEFEKADAKPLTNKMPFCVMVKRAMSGKKVKAVYENFGCLSSARTLGIIEPDEFFSSGRHYRSLGLYQDLTISKNIRQHMTLCQHKAHGVMVKSLEDYEDDPDVVLIVSNPYTAMKVVQAYTHIYGYTTSYKMSGNQAICSECTASPFESNSINVSLLCSGTRFMSGWGDDELAIGFPFNKFMAIMDGLYATLNLTEPDEKKAEIEARMTELKRDDLTIRYGRNYYSGLYLAQKDKNHES